MPCAKSIDPLVTRVRGLPRTRPRDRGVGWRHGLRPLLHLLQLLPGGVGAVAGEPLLPPGRRAAPARDRSAARHRVSRDCHPPRVSDRGGHPLGARERARRPRRGGLRGAHHAGPADLVGRCGRDDAVDPRRVAGNAGRRGGGRRPGRARVYRLDVACAGPGLAAQSADRRGGRGDRGRGSRRAVGARRDTGVADRHSAGRRRGRPGRGGCGRTDRRHRRVLRRWADTAGRAARVGVGVAESAAGPPCRRGLVGVRGGIPQRVVPAGTQRALHRADRVRGVHHRGGRRIPARGCGRRAGSRLRHRRLYPAGRHAAAGGAGPIERGGTGRAVHRGSVRRGRGAGRGDPGALPPAAR